MPLYALVFMVFTMAKSVAGHVGLRRRVPDAARHLQGHVPTATFASLGVILSAGYALWLYRKVVFGALEKPRSASIKDLTFREGLTAVPADRPHHPVRRLSEAGAGHVGGLGAGLVENYDTAMTAVKAAALLQ